jgi:hypothetical protein
MKHPRLSEQQIVDRAAGQIPWSAETERELRRKIAWTWYEMWAYLVGALLFLSGTFLLHRYWMLALTAFSLGYGITRLYALALLRENLGEEMRRGPRGEFFEGSGMLANKPRSLSRLTKWIEHVPGSIEFICFDPDATTRCGEQHHWKDAQWIPNYDAEVFEPEEHPGTVDPGGGRYVILCPCGLGHFKLKA